MGREAVKTSAPSWFAERLGPTGIGRKAITAVPRQIRDEGSGRLGRETVPGTMKVGFHARVEPVTTPPVMVGGVVEEGLPAVEEETGHEVPSAVVVTHLERMAEAATPAETGSGSSEHPVANGPTTTPAALNRAVLASRSSRVSRGAVPPVDDQVPIGTWDTGHETLNNTGARAHAVPAAGLTATVGDVPLDLGPEVRFTRAAPVTVPVETLAAARRVLFVAMAGPVARAPDVKRPASVADTLPGRRGSVTASAPRMAAVDTTVPEGAPVIGEGAPSTGEGMAVLRVGPTALGPVAPGAHVGRGRRRSVIGKAVRRPAIPALIPREVLMPVPVVLGQDGPLTSVGTRVGRATALTPFPEGLLGAQAVGGEATTAGPRVQVEGALLAFPGRSALPETRRAMDAKGIAELEPLPGPPTRTPAVPTEIAAVPARRGGAVPAISPVLRAGVTGKGDGADPPVIGVAEVTETPRMKAAGALAGAGAAALPAGPCAPARPTPVEPGVGRYAASSAGLPSGAGVVPAA